MFEVLISAGIHPKHATAPQTRHTFIVLYNYSSPPTFHQTLLHTLDNLGHVVIAPHHPDRLINSSYGFSERAHFYQSTNPFGPIDDTYWERVLTHAQQHTGKKEVTQLIMVDDQEALQASELRYTLHGLKSQLLSAIQSMTIQVYPIDNDNEAYHRAVGRYNKMVKLTAPEMVKDAVNGMAITNSNMLTKDSIIKGATERIQFAMHFADAAGLSDGAEKMLHHWSARKAFIEGEPVYLTFKKRVRESGGVADQMEGLTLEVL